MKFCIKCVYPSSAAIPLTFDGAGKCSACRVAEQRDQINWDARWNEFNSLVNEYRNRSNYDCIVPVSGGKDSYYQCHVVTSILGLKPLLVTYHGNNFPPEGEKNLLRMREVFDCDHIIVRPSQDRLIKMNRLGFFVQGDMNWHNHCGIMTVPIQIAVRYQIPLIIWGEHGFLDLSGMFSYADKAEFTAKTRLEHDLRGYEVDDFTDEGLQILKLDHLKEGLTIKDMLWGIYPTDNEIKRVGVRGVYLGNYIRWGGNKNAALAKELYDWQEAQEPFERTYRRISNVDDIHENGIHDYMKFLKFGYGRASDHASKDIRDGTMTREEGIEIVRKYDSVKPRRDLLRWLTYVGMTEDEFDRTADTFRSPHVWEKKNGYWIKENIWGKTSEYGRVFE